MKAPLFAACATLFALAVIPPSNTVQASTGFQRCIAIDGTAIYTDKACGAFGKEAAPIPGELLARLAADERMHVQDVAELDSDNSISGNALPIGRRAASGCARTPKQLALDLSGSFALHDVNRIAESYHWAGMHHAQAQQVMSRLESLSKRAVRDAQYFNAQIASLSSDGSLVTHTGGSAGVLQLQLAGNGYAMIDFDVTKYADCYFVHF